MKSRALIQLRSLAAHPLSRWVGLPAMCAVGLVIAWAQTVPPALPPTVNLASEPLYARGARAKPTLTLALSVEFPTVGAQYVGASRATDDASYSPDNKYIGYYDSESCYVYKRDGDASSRYFYRSGPATDRQCGGEGFSGNFMNWATSSAIDVLRLGLTGGDRVLDTKDLTVLQRAVLPARDTLPGGNDTFWNGVNFPSKQVSGKVAQGALPAALTGSNPGTIYIANCLNQIYFGTEKGGRCGEPGNNGNLGVDVAYVPPTGLYSGTLPVDFGSAFAGESYPDMGPSYTVTGTQQIAYGSGTHWAIITQTGGSIACSNVAWATYGVPGLAANGDPLPGAAKECRRRAAPANGGGTGSGKGLTPDPFFYARVQVCESSSGGVLIDPRTELCQRYPQGNYKPVGNLQKHSDSVRVAVFSYLTDNSDDPQRSGGVLRAPMNYVGPRDYDNNFALKPNVNSVQEWDETTGVFKVNPEDVLTPNSGAFSSNPGAPISGAINYLNQFGRTGTLGKYKIYDPVSELYYESLRYLQGLPPTTIGSTRDTNVIQGAADYQDGFPVYTSYADPHPAVDKMTDYSCVKNNIVGIGDVNTWNDKFIPGNRESRASRHDKARKADEAGNEPDFWKWTQVVGAFESKQKIKYEDGAGVVDRETSNPNAANEAAKNLENDTVGSQDSASYYIAGMAYWANTHDIRGTQWNDRDKQRPGMRVTTYWIDVNEFGEQSDPTKRRTNNQFYLAAKYGGFKDVTGTGNPYKMRNEKGEIVDDPANLNWERKSSNPDLQEAKNYFLASSAQSVIDALDEIFKNIAAEANSIAGAAISSSQVTDSASGLVYQAKFDPANWSGDLVAYELSLSSDKSQLVISDQISSVWALKPKGPAVGVAGRLDAREPKTRNIYVGSTSGNAATFSSSAFTWDQVGDSVKKALYDDKTETADVQGQNRLNYLRGDHTLEVGGKDGGKFRPRSSRLGDIVNSGIVYVAEPSRAISDVSYASFYDSAKDREPTLYVGANDGMLHAFSAVTGDELFAYIPSWVVPNLIDLTKASYKHRSYVDATPAVAEANLGSSTSADWRTVLVGGTGGGGQGVYALDVSDPGGFDNDHVLWEFTDRDDADMGNVIGTPRILKMNVAAGSATPDYRYFAVVASGVNNHATSDVDKSASLTGEPALFFLQLGKSKSEPWELGRNYYKVKFPVVTDDAALPSGLINFSVRGDLNGAVSYLYAGDLQGNLWKLDFRTTPADQWSLETLSPFKSASGTALPLFVATDGADTPHRQPITMAPTLTFGPLRNSIIVSFGTGRYLSEDDNRAPFRTQSVYGVLDNNTDAVDSPVSEESNLPEAAIMGRGRLRQVGVSTSSLVSSPFIWGRPSASNAESLERAGWYFDFDSSGTTATSTGTGERQIGGFVVQAGRLIFGSVIPAVNSCDNGSGVQYQVSVLTGNGTAIVSTLGVLGEPLLVQLGGSVLDVSDPTGLREETTTKQAIVPTSGGLTGTSPLSYTRPTGRLSWREISNYQDLKNQDPRKTP